MLNEIKIDTTSQNLDLGGLELRLCFEDVEEQLENYNVSMDGEKEMKLHRMIVKGLYIYKWTHYFPQNYKFEFIISGRNIDGKLSIPMVGEHDVVIDIRTKDESGWGRWGEGYLPQWNSVTLSTAGHRTDSLEDITRLERGLRIARHLTMLVESWKALKSVADLEAHKKFMRDEERKK
tara:strand:+ start:16 stop:549 length:534 start_codon:yes stop_codon:yes gene_type:complete